MSSCTVTVYCRIQPLSDDEWRARIVALSDVERVEFDEMLRAGQRPKAIVTFWPDLVQCSMHPFVDAQVTT